MFYKPSCFCKNCNAYVAYTLKTITHEDKEHNITYDETHAICNECGKPAYIPALVDLNTYRRKKAMMEDCFNDGSGACSTRNKS